MIPYEKLAEHFSAQCRAVWPLIDAILSSDGIAASVGADEHRNDIAATLLGQRPGLASDGARLIASGRPAEAIAMIRNALAELRDADPDLFFVPSTDKSELIEAWVRVRPDHASAKAHAHYVGISEGRRELYALRKKIRAEKLPERPNRRPSPPGLVSGDSMVGLNADGSRKVS